MRPRPVSNRQAGQICRFTSPAILAPHFSQTLIAVVMTEECLVSADLLWAFTLREH